MALHVHFYNTHTYYPAHICATGLCGWLCRFVSLYVHIFVHVYTSAKTGCLVPYRLIISS